MEADFLYAYSTAPGTDTHTNAFCEYQIKYSQKVLESARFFLKQLILLFNKDTLNSSKAKVKTIMML